VLVGGEAGIGKTRLARELAEHATGRGATVLVGACRNLGQVPYTPVVDALRALVRSVEVEAVRELAKADFADLTQLLLTAFQENKATTVQVEADSKPLLLIINPTQIAYIALDQDGTWIGFHSG